LGVEVKNSEAFYLKTQKQERKEAALKRKDDAREARLEAMKKEQIMLKKRAIIQQYLAHAQLSNNKNIDIPHFVLQPPDGGQELVSGAALRLLSGRRYGLIGRNGVGKTCLLSAMAAYEIKDFPKHLRVMHVEQEAAGGDETVIEHVLAADAERDMLLTEEKRLNDQIEGRFVEKPHKAPEDRLEEVIPHESMSFCSIFLISDFVYFKICRFTFV
jgi:ATP-binding cassette subfamily F protein 3